MPFLAMKDLRGYLTEEQVETLLNKPEKLRDKAIFHILYYCGRRVSEVLRLTPKDILWQENIIIFYLLKKKGLFPIRVPVSHKALDILRQYIEQKGIKIGRIFKISRSQVFRLMRHYCKECGILWIGEKRPHPHHLRHSFAIHWIKRDNSSESLRMLQMILGHSKIDTTAQYLQFSPHDIQRKYDQIFG